MTSAIEQAIKALQDWRDWAKALAVGIPEAANSEALRATVRRGDEAIRLLQTVHPQDWRPIEDGAPLDLTEVDVYDPNEGVCAAQFECHAPVPFWSRDVHDLKIPGEYDLADIQIHPTHWRPRPAPPKIEGEG